AFFLQESGSWAHQEAFEQGLGSAPRLLLGGWSAYLLGQHLDVWGFFLVKSTRFGGQQLRVRSWRGTRVGQLIDTAVFITIAFAGAVPLLPTILGQYLVKLC